MSYNLFLDDERKPSDVTWVSLPLCAWTVARNYNQFVETVTKLGLPYRVSFDHDLADEHYAEYVNACNPLNFKQEFRYDKMYERTGYECAKWLVHYCQTHGQPFPEYYIHTLNPIGRENIEKYVENYKKFVDSFRES